jgi:Glu-tRNA(Gln) amidotransferase subunit E-like FAD-binding protein
VPLSEGRIERAKGRLPLLPWERRAYYRKLGLPPEIIEDLIADQRGPLFRQAMETLPLRPTLAAVILSHTLKSLERKGFPIAQLSDESLLDLLRRFTDGEFAREGFPDILKLMSIEGCRPGETIAKLGLVKLSDEDVREIVQIVGRVERSLDPQDLEKKWRYLMGVLMAELRGRAPGEKVASLLREVLETGT